MIGILTAMESEARPFLMRMENRTDFTLLGKKISKGSLFGAACELLVTGVGKVNAAISAQALAGRGATLLFNFGLAGSLTPQLAGNAVALVTHAVQYDFDLSAINRCEIGKLEEFPEPYLQNENRYLSRFSGIFPCCRLATGDRFTEDLAEARFLRDTLKADLRDMEGGAVFQAAHFNGLPVLCFKCVSDNVFSNCHAEYQINKLSAISAFDAELPKIFEVIRHG